MSGQLPKSSVVRLESDEVALLGRLLGKVADLEGVTGSLRDTLHAEMIARRDQDLRTETHLVALAAKISAASRGVGAGAIVLMVLEVISAILR